MFKTYLPNVINQRQPRYGLAFAYPPISDLSALQVEWFYTWGCNVISYGDMKSIPMCWDRFDDRLGRDYAGWMLVFNEPNVKIQANLTVEEGLEEFRKIRDFYAKAKFVIGNVSIFATDWLREFNKVIPIERIGIHCYVEAWIDVKYISATLDKLYKDIPVPMWVTEFNYLRPEASKFATLLQMLDSKPYIERLAPYTNRQKGDEWWSLPHCDLMTDDKPNDKGLAYKNNRKVMEGM